MCSWRLALRCSSKLVLGLRQSLTSEIYFRTDSCPDSPRLSPPSSPGSSLRHHPTLARLQAAVRLHTVLATRTVLVTRHRWILSSGHLSRLLRSSSPAAAGNIYHTTRSEPELDNFLRGDEAEFQLRHNRDTPICLPGNSSKF